MTQALTTFAKNNKGLIIAVVLAILFAWLIFRKKDTDKPFDVNIIIPGASGGANDPLVQQQDAAATSFATQLNNDITGFNLLGHDAALYKSLADSSDYTFALTFSKYKQMTGNNLTADMNGEVYLGPSYDEAKRVEDRSKTFNPPLV